MARNRIKQVVCANCTYTFKEGENFCPNCGQENHSPNQPVKHYISELVESLFHLDSKFFTTIYQLVRYPGKVTKDFTENRRKRFMAPIRLYVFISFVFFLMVQWQTGEEEGAAFEPTVSIKDSEGQKTKIASFREDSISFDTEDSNGKTNINLFGYNMKFDVHELRKYKNPSPQQIDSIIICEGAKPDYFIRKLTKQFIKSIGDTDNFKEHFIQKFYKLGSISLFLLMPIFALLLKLLHFTRNKYYYEYLIFSIHYHSYCFLIFTILLLCNALIGVHPSFYFLSILLFMAYLAMAMRRNYPQSRFMAIGKTFLMYFLYGIVLLIFFVIIILLGLWVA